MVSSLFAILRPVLELVLVPLGGKDDQPQDHAQNQEPSQAKEKVIEQAPELFAKEVQTHGGIAGENDHNQPLELIPDGVQKIIVECGRGLAHESFQQGEKKPSAYQVACQHYQARDGKVDPVISLQTEKRLAGQSQVRCDLVDLLSGRGPGVGVGTAVLSATAVETPATSGSDGGPPPSSAGVPVASG